MIKKLLLKILIVLYIALSCFAFFITIKYFFFPNTHPFSLRDLIFSTPPTTLVDADIAFSSSPGYQGLPPLFASSMQELILQNKDFLEADLGEMVLRRYEKGVVVDTYPIRIKGKEGSWGETVSGVFSIGAKKELHFSSLGQVYMPWALFFQGNYSIHGIPYEPDGTILPNSFSSGCINMNTDDAKEIFKKTPPGTPLIVHEDDFKNGPFVYPMIASDVLAPQVSASAYLVADLENGTILAQKDASSVYPMASVTKLMTALVASEYNLLSYKEYMTTQITITSDMTLPIGELSSITPGKTYSFFELLYPLLIPSSNDAAEALATHRGKTNFISLMNDRALSLEMHNTRFADSYGWDSGNVSSPTDLYNLARYIYNNRHWIYDITRGRVFNDFGAIHFTNLVNQNLYMTDPMFVGGKVGATPIAWKTGVFVFNIPFGDTTRPVAFVVLHSSDNKKDVDTLRAWVAEHISFTESLVQEIIPEGSVEEAVL